MQSGTVEESRVKLSNMKRFALDKLPEGPLRDDILSQPDEVSSGEYLTNCRVWLRLARAAG